MPSSHSKRKAARPRAPAGGALKTIPASEGAAALGNAVARVAKAMYRPVLVVIAGEQIGLRKLVEGNIVIGRDPSADLVLTDGLVSGHHAMLEDRGDSWALVDLGSTNGTSVNGQRQTEAILAAGDKIAVGMTILRFEMQDQVEQSYNEFLERLLTTDDLSGLYVRRKFDVELKVAIEAARAAQSTVGLLVMDLDGVKGINDAHGHLFGAYVIGESGQIISRVIEGRGFATRFGGDEYIAALPGVTLTEAVEVGERIRQAIHSHRFEREGIRLSPGISVGAAAFPESATDARALFQRADEALYRAKRAGKNRVCV